MTDNQTEKARAAVQIGKGLDAKRMIRWLVNKDGSQTFTVEDYYGRAIVADHHEDPATDSEWIEFVGKYINEEIDRVWT